MTRSAQRAVWGAYVVVFLAGNGIWAVPTPYDRLPAAIVTQDYGARGLVWDYELAERLDNPNRQGAVVAVMDFCHSGGFVNELSRLGNLYIATACDWDEYSWTEPVAFGQRFMNASKTATLHESYETAKNAVVRWQTPQEASGGLGTRNLDWDRGYQALLFSAGDENPAMNESFWKDISTAWHALRERPTWPWPRSAIESYFGDGSQQSPEIFIRGPATRANLLSAVVDLLPYEDNDLLFLYLNNHGMSTDVLKSRYRGGRYEYELTTSIYRTDDDVKYGIWKVRHEVPDPNLGNYKNIQVPKAGWDVRILGGWMEWYSTNPYDPTTWLVSGVDYSFGYEYPAPPKQVSWDDWVWKVKTNTDEEEAPIIGRAVRLDRRGACPASTLLQKLPQPPQSLFFALADCLHGDALLVGNVGLRQPLPEDSAQQTLFRRRQDGKRQTNIVVRARRRTHLSTAGTVPRVTPLLSISLQTGIDCVLIGTPETPPQVT